MFYVLGKSGMGRKSNAEALKARTKTVNPRKKREEMRKKATAVTWHFPCMLLPDEIRISRKQENDVEAQYTVTEGF